MCGFKCLERDVVVGTTISTVIAMWRLLESYLTEERFMDVSNTFPWPREKVDPIVLINMDDVLLSFMPLTLTFPNHISPLALF